MDIDTERRRIGADLAALRFQLALVRSEIERKYSPNQARVPAGSSEGGRWTDEGGGFGYVSPSQLPELDDGVFRPEIGGAPRLEPVAKRAGAPVDLREEERARGHAVARHVGRSEASRRLELASKDRHGIAFDYVEARPIGSFDSVGTATAMSMTLSHPIQKRSLRSSAARPGNHSQTL